MPFVPLELTQFEVLPGVSWRRSVATVDHGLRGGAATVLRARHATFPAAGDHLRVQAITLGHDRCVVASWALHQGAASWSAVERLPSWGFPLEYVLTVERARHAPGVIRFALGIEIHPERDASTRGDTFLAGASPWMA